jgi:hypothetical protein
MTVECKYVTLLKGNEVEIQFEYDNHELTFVVHIGTDTVESLFEEIQHNYHILFGAKPTKKVLNEWNAVLGRYLPRKVGRFIVYHK